jgi:hypothetical protein
MGLSAMIKVPKSELFYSIKPLFPRPLQLGLRRAIAGIQRRKHADIWPINEGAALPPPGWNGWPEGKRFAWDLHHDVETSAGQDKCSALMDLEERLGVRSTFFIVPERYPVSESLIEEIKRRGFGLGVHGLHHDGKLFQSYEKFRKDAERINGYLRAWGTRGFSAPSMIYRHEWMHHLDIDHSTGAFDTDPFAPEPSPTPTIFPFIVRAEARANRFVELPCTLVQDHTLFVILKERTIDVWKRKMDWIAAHKGLALFITHPDYMNFDAQRPNGPEEYPTRFYSEMISYVQATYAGQYWNPLSADLAAFVNSQGPA